MTIVSSHASRRSACRVSTTRTCSAVITTASCPLRCSWGRPGSRQITKVVPARRAAPRNAGPPCAPRPPMAVAMEVTSSWSGPQQPLTTHRSSGGAARQQSGELGDVAVVSLGRGVELGISVARRVRSDLPDARRPGATVVQRADVVGRVQLSPPQQAPSLDCRWAPYDAVTIGGRASDTPPLVANGPDRSTSVAEPIEMPPASICCATSRPTHSPTGYRPISIV